MSNFECCGRTVVPADHTTHKSVAYGPHVGRRIFPFNVRFSVFVCFIRCSRRRGLNSNKFCLFSRRTRVVCVCAQFHLRDFVHSAYKKRTHTHNHVSVKRNYRARFFPHFSLCIGDAPHEIIYFCRSDVCRGALQIQICNGVFAALHWH